jgi:ABC-type glutathione transport system ATPase component
MTDLLVKVEDLKKYFPVTGGVMKKTVGYVYAVDGVSFDIPRGGTVGLVGESGCGKTTVGRCILRLINPTEGKILFNNEDILKWDRERLRHLRREMQIVFQDPYASMNPRWMIKDIVGEPLLINGLAKGLKLYETVLESLMKVGLSEDVSIISLDNPCFSRRKWHVEREREIARRICGCIAQKHVVKRDFHYTAGSKLDARDCHAGSYGTSCRI